ncbi:PAS domain-containing protein [Streptomyces sp. NPDC047108]|uniref:response regulator n=1 Tax=Streptomyces sp. NPDC047108 TaxID=3155025 RepID=UPI0033EB1AB4
MSSRPSRGAARLAAILDALPDALLLVNCNGTVVNANTIALETFEAPGTALVGRGLLDLLPSFDSRRIPGSMRRPEDDEGRTKPTRMVARRTDGSEFPVEVTSANLEDGRTPYADPSPKHYTGDELLMLVVRDLSGTVDTEAELARQQRQTEMILRAAAEGVVGVDTDGKVVLVNPSAAQILGYRAGDLGGQELHPLIHHSRPDGSPLPYNETPLADSLRSGRKHRVRGQVLWAKDGRAVPVDLTTAPVRDGEQLVGAVMTFTDRRTYNAVSARHAQLLAVLDEALRGPLDQLRSELGTLASDPAGQLWPEANQILHYLTAGYARMTTLIDNVLSYQRLDTGKERLDRAPVSLDGVVAAGVEGAIELIGPGRAQFAVHAPPIEAEVDAKRLAQALAHLIADVAGVDATGNAPAGGSSGDSTIVVAAAQRGEVVRIEVRGPYAGGDPVHEPIVRGIVERHGGVLQTHEVPGTSGNAYVLEVPLSADRVTPERIVDARDRENATTVMPVPTQRQRGTDVPHGAAADPAQATGATHATGAAANGTNGGARSGPTGSGGTTVPAQSTGSEPAPTGRRRARRGPEGDPAAGGGPGVPGGHPGDPSMAGQSMAGQSVAGQEGTGVPGSGPQGQGADGPAAQTRPTGRRRGRPSPAEAESVPPGGVPGGEAAGGASAEAATAAAGAPRGRRARHGGRDQSSGAVATAADERTDAGDGTNSPAQNGMYAAGATGTGGGQPQGRATASQGSALPALPGAADGGPQAPQGQGQGQGQQGQGQQGLSPVPSQLRPAGMNGTNAPMSAPVPQQGTAPEEQGTTMEPAARRGRRLGTPAQGTPAAPEGLPQPYGAGAEAGEPAAPQQGQPVPPGGRRVRRALASGGQEQTAEAGAERQALALPPAESDRTAGPAEADRPGLWTGDEQNRHDPMAPGVDADHTPPQAHPVPAPSGRRRARRDPAEDQQQGRRPTADTVGPTAPQSAPAQGFPAQGDQGFPDQQGPAGPPPQQSGVPGALPATVDRSTPATPTQQPAPQQPAPQQPAAAQQPQPEGGPEPTSAQEPHPQRVAQPLPAEEPAPPAQDPAAAAQAAQPTPAQAPSQAQAQGTPQPNAPQGQPSQGRPPAPEGPSAAQSRAISVRTLGQGVPFAQQIADQQRPQPSPPAQPSAGSGRRRRLAAPPQEDDRTASATGAQESAARLREQQQAQPPRLLDSTEGRAYAIGAPDEGSEGPEPLDGPNGAIDVTDSQAAPPLDDELPPEPLDNPRRLLVWPAPDVATQQALSDRGYRPVIVHSREEVDAQIAAYPAALFVDPLTGPITRTALQSLRTAAVAAEVPVLVTAGLGQATREAAYGADPAVLLKALAPRDSEQHPPRVLLIEAHDPIAGALTATLERRGMQVGRAASDADAVTLAAQMRPNLVVMDLMQVRRRRAGIVDWLRANGLLNRTPLVVYTSADIDPAELPRLTSGETVLFLAERSTSPDVQNRIVDLLAKIGAN